MDQRKHRRRMPEIAILCWLFPHAPLLCITICFRLMRSIEKFATSLLPAAFLATLFNHLFDGLPSHCAIRRSRCRDRKSIARWSNLGIVYNERRSDIGQIYFRSCVPYKRCIVEASKWRGPKSAFLVPHPWNRLALSSGGYKWIESLFLHGREGNWDAEFACRRRRWKKSAAAEDWGAVRNLSGKRPTPPSRIGVKVGGKQSIRSISRGPIPK